MGNAQGEHIIGVVAEQGGALGQLGVNQDWRLAAREELRAVGGLGDRYGVGAE